MEDVCKELDEVRSELENLKAEHQIKKELSESLKKAYDGLLLKFEEAKQQIEKQTLDLDVKSEEVAEARKTSEKLESSLSEKELFLEHLSSVNENLKAEFRQKLQFLEGEKKELVLALDEVTARNKELEQTAWASNQEIVGIKKLLLVTEKKCFEAEQWAQEAKERRKQDDVVLKLEEEIRNVQDQLKWKKERFMHLEEAHKGLQDQFQMNKKEWEMEKSALIDEISSLQRKLDSQTRILEDLRTRLEACNQALVHEESRRKLLEIQMSEFESHFDNVFAQCEKEKSKIETLSMQRNEEIGKLRNMLGVKETLAKEKEFEMVHLEQENQELMETLKELQDAPIRNAGVSSLNKLRKPRSCSKNLKEKESEWFSQTEKMKGDITSHQSELKCKEDQVKKLKVELESCHSIIEILNEEIPILLTIFKSYLSEACSVTHNVNTELQEYNKENEDEFSLLAAQLEMKNSSLDNAYLKLSEEHGKVEALLKRVVSLDLIKQQKVILEEELQQHRRMLLESHVHQSHLKDQLLQMESAANDYKKNVSEALEKKNLEFAEKICEASQLRHQLQQCESNAERLKVCVEEQQETCRQMESSLFAQANTVRTLNEEKKSLICVLKEQERKIEDLRQRIVLLESRVAAKTKDMEVILKEKQNLAQNAKEKDSCIENLQKDITRMKQESSRKESEAATLVKSAAEKAFVQEKDTLLKLMDEKEQSIKTLQLLTVSLKQDLTSAVISSFSDAIENQVKIDVLTECLKKSKNLAELETEKMNKMISDLKKEVCSSHHRLKYKEESLLYAKHEAKQLQALLESNRLENEKLMNEYGRMECIVKQLEHEKEVLLQDNMKLTTEREETLNNFEVICNQIGEFSIADAEMMQILGKMLQRSEEDTRDTMDLVVHHELYNSTSKNSKTSFLATENKFHGSIDARPPLKEVNF